MPLWKAYGQRDFSRRKDFRKWLCERNCIVYNLWRSSCDAKFSWYKCGSVSWAWSQKHGGYWGKNCRNRQQGGMFFHLVYLLWSWQFFFKLICSSSVCVVTGSTQVFIPFKDPSNGLYLKQETISLCIHKTSMSVWDWRGFI